jgi:glycosyltransferase involved in cell wall biosynthesis
LKNILTINTANSGGGAEKVAYNLCRELHLRGYHSKMLARTIDFSIDQYAKELVLPVPGNDVLYSAGNYLDEKLSTHSLFYLPTWKIPFMELIRTADLIHLHNMHGYYFNIMTIPFLMWQKPVVWTLHDMWSFTGKCTWSFECERFSRSCGECPQLAAYPVQKKDTSAFQLKLKKFLYANRKYVIVTPSAWLQSNVQKSILKHVPTYVVPSPIDTKVFYPEDKSAARQRLGIPEGKTVIMFIASWVNTIAHKGIDAFLDMLARFYSERQDMYTIIVGHLQGQSVLKDRFAGLETGYVTDPNILRACYASSDVFVSPTLAENSSCTIVEAMACGAPTVAYATGGVPEQIIHGQTGFLAPPGDRQLLYEAIKEILNTPEKKVSFGKAGAHRAVENFAMDVFFEKYLNVYKETITLRNH